MPPQLRLVVRERAESAPGSGRAALWALLFGLVALAATLAGADRARRAQPAQEIARDALTAALAHGSGDRQVRLAARTLRRRLERQPLDSKTRVAYAGVLHGLSRSVADTAAAAFHARLAAELAPVTVPVVRSAAVVLARSNEWSEALDLVTTMFGYDAEAAARLLRTLEPRLAPEDVERALPDAPSAWLAWIDALGADAGRRTDDRWLDRALERWPNHGPLIDRVATRLSREGDLDGLVELFAADAALDEVSENARVFAFRARARALGGDAEGARHDIASSLRLDGDDPRVLLVAGDAHEALGDDEDARMLWSRAQFAAPASASTIRVRALVRLARLEDRLGRAGNALRLWRSIREIDHEHGEAARRIEALTGVPPPC